MKLARTLVRIACLALAVGCLSSAAQAQTFGLHGSLGFGHPGFFGYSSPYASGRIPTPPYFAIHPPVYYSAPVPRSYGYSPYAYPGTVRTPEVTVQASAEIITNPHVEQPELESTNNVKVVRYQIIENPYVRAELRANQEQRYVSADK